MNWSRMMDATYWHKQTATQPLFPDLLWSRPENKLHAGKLLVIGGNLYGFSAPAEAYAMASQAGIGTARVLLPDCLRKTVGNHLTTAEFGPCTPSGSFNRQALGVWLEQAAWADGVLLAGDLGRNSETAILLESFLEKYSGPVTLTKDALGYLNTNPLLALSRPNTTLVLSLSQLQKLARSVNSPTAVTFGMDLLRLVDFLHDFTATRPTQMVVRHLGMLFVASQGKVSTTKLPNDAPEIWRVPTAAKCTVWWLQHPEKPFEALTTAVFPADK